MERNTEILLKQAIEKLDESNEKLENQFKKFQKSEQELEKEVEQIQKSQNKRQESITEIKSREFTELTFDIVCDLFKVADELLENISQGRVGQNLNFKLLQLYNRVVDYRKKMVKGLAMVKNENRLDAIQIRKDLKRNFNSNYVKIRSDKTKKRLKDF